VFSQLRRLCNVLGHRGINEEVLTQGFGKTEAVALQKGPDFVDVTQIHSRSCLFILYEGSIPSLPGKGKCFSLSQEEREKQKS
jgi:hypothetical protein